jgi:hypothetical protein
MHWADKNIFLQGTKAIMPTEKTSLELGRHKLFRGSSGIQVARKTSTDNFFCMNAPWRQGDQTSL